MHKFATAFVNSFLPFHGDLSKQIEWKYKQGFMTSSRFPDHLQAFTIVLWNHGPSGNFVFYSIDDRVLTAPKKCALAAAPTQTCSQSMFPSIIVWEARKSWKDIILICDGDFTRRATQNTTLSWKGEHRLVGENKELWIAQIHSTS